MQATRSKRSGWIILRLYRIWTCGCVLSALWTCCRYHKVTSNPSGHVWMQWVASRLSKLHKSNVNRLFFSYKSHPVSDSDLVQQAWLACRVSTLPQRAVRFHMQRRIGTNMVPDEVCTGGEKQDVRIHSVSSWHNIWQWWPSCRVTGSFEILETTHFTCSRYPTSIRT